MSRLVFRIAVIALLIGVIASAGVTVLAKPRPGDTGGFMACPFPPCMAPCLFGVEPQVLCKLASGGVVKTTFACCCCGGSGPANSFKVLR